MKIYLIDYVDGYMAGWSEEIRALIVLPFWDGHAHSVPSDTILIFKATPALPHKPEFAIAQNTRIVFGLAIRSTSSHYGLSKLQARHQWIHEVALNTYLLPLKRKHQAFVRLCWKRSRYFLWIVQRLTLHVSDWM